jgi:hypothetical protein
MMNPRSRFPLKSTPKSTVKSTAKLAAAANKKAAKLTRKKAASDAASKSAEQLQRENLTEAILRPEFNRIRATSLQSPTQQDPTDQMTVEDHLSANPLLPTLGLPVNTLVSLTTNSKLLERESDHVMIDGIQIYFLNHYSDLCFQFIKDLLHHAGLDRYVSQTTLAYAIQQHQQLYGHWNSDLSPTCCISVPLVRQECQHPNG